MFFNIFKAPTSRRDCLRVKYFHSQKSILRTCLNFQLLPLVLSLLSLPLWFQVCEGRTRIKFSRYFSKKKLIFLSAFQCFMNSILQCLCKSSALRKYFFNKDYTKDINTQFKPTRGLLTKGKLLLSHIRSVFVELCDASSCRNNKDRWSVHWTKNLCDFSSFGRYESRKKRKWYFINPFESANIRCWQLKGY